LNLRNGEVIALSSCGAQSRGIFKQAYNGLSLREAYESVAPSVYNFAAVLDLNGDGKLEVIVYSFYYEGGKQPFTDVSRTRLKPRFRSSAERETANDGFTAVTPPCARNSLGEVTVSL
jgi:hypothetical protein